MNWFGIHFFSFLLTPLLAFSAFLGIHGEAAAPNIATSSSTSSQAVACTLEAKICPNGRSVGRVGPDCHFAPCPDGSSTTQGQQGSTPASASPSAQAAVIYSITPAQGSIGTTVTIDGVGLEKNDEVHFGGGIVEPIAVETGPAIMCARGAVDCHAGVHERLMFSVPSALEPACATAHPRCLIAARETLPGTYAVSVANNGRESNVVSFTVTEASSTSDANVPPTIVSIAPSAGPVGTTVTIGGEGFTGNNVIHFGAGIVGHVAAEPAVFHCPMMQPGADHPCGGFSETITFIVPAAVGPDCEAGQMCPMYRQAVELGGYAVFVKNENGTTTPSAFTVTGE